VTNLFDEEPPFANETSAPHAGYNAPQHDPRGRHYLLARIGEGIRYNLGEWRPRSFATVSFVSSSSRGRKRAFTCTSRIPTVKPSSGYADGSLGAEHRSIACTASTSADRCRSAFPGD
jgi:hypothetical protein